MFIIEIKNQKHKQQKALRTTEIKRQCDPLEALITTELKTERF
jgi:hypothetical protein